MQVKDGEFSDHDRQIKANHCDWTFEFSRVAMGGKIRRGICLHFLTAPGPETEKNSSLEKSERTERKIVDLDLAADLG